MTGRRAHQPNFPTRDHVIPRSLGGGGGVLMVCRKCNGDKAALTIEEWLAVLRSRRDPRADVVRRLLDDLAQGVTRIAAPNECSSHPIGLMEGLFS